MDALKIGHATLVGNSLGGMIAEWVALMHPARVSRLILLDGTLKIAMPEKADAVVETSLADYRRDALRYSEGEDIQEYRLSITIDAKMIQKSGGKVLWSKRIIGDTTFFLAGARAISEDQAASRAVEDVARRVVEATIEYW